MNAEDVIRLDLQTLRTDLERVYDYSEVVGLVGLRNRISDALASVEEALAFVKPAPSPTETSGDA